MNLEAVRSDALPAASPPQAILAAASPVREGFRRDRTQRIAALLVWTITLVVALVAVWPAWGWWSSALGLRLGARSSTASISSSSMSRWNSSIARACSTS